MSGLAWTTARQLAAAIADGVPAVRVWRRTAAKHPDWCAQDHRCTAGRLPSGEHRGDPLVWRTPYGSIIATRVSTRTGRSWLELRTDVRLDPDEDRAHRQASLLAVGVDLTVRAVLAEALGSGPALPSGDGPTVRALRPAAWARSALPPATHPRPIDGG